MALLGGASRAELLLQLGDRVSPGAADVLHAAAGDQIAAAMEADVERGLAS